MPKAIGTYIFTEVVFARTNLGMTSVRRSGYDWPSTWPRECLRRLGPSLPLAPSLSQLHLEMNYPRLRRGDVAFTLYRFEVEPVSRKRRISGSLPLDRPWRTTFRARSCKVSLKITARTPKYSQDCGSNMLSCVAVDKTLGSVQHVARA